MEIDSTQVKDVYIYIYIFASLLFSRKQLEAEILVRGVLKKWKLTCSLDVKLKRELRTV